MDYIGNHGMLIFLIQCLITTDSLKNNDKGVSYETDMLILFSLCLISIGHRLFSKDNISSNEIFYQSSSEITSSESEESEISSEENNQPEASSRSNLPENHQQIIESSESAAKESYLKIIHCPHPTHKVSHPHSTTNP